MQTTELQARMAHPAFAAAGAMDALVALGKAVEGSGVPRKTLELMNLRASQINGCGVCAVQHPRIARKLGESDQRQALAGLVLSIASINLWNRLNVVTREVAGLAW